MRKAAARTCVSALASSTSSAAPMAGERATASTISVSSAAQQRTGRQRGGKACERRGGMENESIGLMRLRGYLARLRGPRASSPSSQSTRPEQEEDEEHQQSGSKRSGPS